MSAINEQIRNNFIQLEKLIESANRVLVTSHERADGDGLGSMLGLLHHLVERNKKVICFAKDFEPAGFHFLPGVETVLNTPEAIEDHQADLIILLDSGDIRRTHILDYLRRRDRQHFKIVNIDHHPPQFSEPDHQQLIDIHIVDQGMSATAELVFHFFDHHNHDINKDIATCLLTGILTDTGNFSNKATTDSSMSVAGSLLLSGANLQQITDMIIRNQSTGSLKLWGRALSRLTNDPKTGITTTAIKLNDLVECQVSADAADGIANFLNNLKDAKAIIVYREEADGVIRGSLRTTRDDVDVAKIASQYGGGGHAKAAGFTTTGKLVETSTGWRIK
ncbi:bifunctional oligoribonuclease/PAP phosphatase NrnA [Patescibacteria group bacterium]